VYYQVGEMAASFGFRGYADWPQITTAGEHFFVDPTSTITGSTQRTSFSLRGLFARSCNEQWKIFLSNRIRPH
jgi:hypothetical protein